MSFSRQQISNTLSARIRRLSKVSSSTVSFLSSLTWTLIRSGCSLPESNGMFSFISSRMGILHKKHLSSVLTIGSVFTFAFLGFTADLRFRFLLLSLIRNLLFLFVFSDFCFNFSATDSVRRFFNSAWRLFLFRWRCKYSFLANRNGLSLNGFFG